MASEISSFSGQWAFLSNFHPAPLVWEGIEYQTSEHAFNAGKTTDPAERQRIAAAPTPGMAKRLGRRVTLRGEWDRRVRYETMAAVLRAKFADPQRAAALLATGDATLTEGNRHHDQHWGDCRCGRPACAQPGRNHLGRLLMALRAELQR